MVTNDLEQIDEPIAVVDDTIGVRVEPLQVSVFTIGHRAGAVRTVLLCARGVISDPIVEGTTLTAKRGSPRIQEENEAEDFMKQNYGQIF